MKAVIAFYINTLGNGGAERVISQLANYLSSIEYRVILITSYRVENEYFICEQVERINIESEKDTRNVIKRNFSRIRAVRKICRREKVDVLISFMAEPNFRAVLACIGLPTKNIISIRSDPRREYGGKIGHCIGKFLLPMADGCVFQTEDAKSWFPKRLQKKSTIIFNPLAKAFFEVERKVVCNVVSICRLNKAKNLGMLIRAFQRLANKYPDQNLLIYGNGEMKQELQELIASCSLEQRVKLMGATTDVPTVLAGAGIFVLSSDYEGMPNALMEALAVGVPSVSTDCPCGGPRMLIEHGTNGLLVPVGDEEKLVEALDFLLSDQEFAAQIGKNAAQKARGQFYSEKICAQWVQYIEGIV